MSSEARPSPTRPARFYSIQILRGLAAVLVVLHHLVEQTYLPYPMHGWHRWLDNGAFGVDIFFPISGFVMFLTASKLMAKARKPGDWHIFAWRRIVRVVPLYWFFTVCRIILVLLLPATLFRFPLGFWQAAASFFFIPTLNRLGQPEPVVAVGWTLIYEMLFYAIVTAAIAFGKPLLRWCGAIIGVLSILGMFVPHTTGVAFLADPIELEFLAGIILCAGFARGWRPPVWLAIVILPAALLFALAAPASPYVLEFHRARALVWGVPGALILWASVALEQHIDLSRWRPLLLLGDASFSLYLMHTFILPVVHARLGIGARLTGARELAFFALSFGVSIAAAIAFHVWVELPVTRWLLDTRAPWSMRSADSANSAR
jgi:exopolysaccharide production protein ExoZ